MSHDQQPTESNPHPRSCRAGCADFDTSRGKHGACVHERQGPRGHEFTCRDFTYDAACCDFRAPEPVTASTAPAPQQLTPVVLESPYGTRPDGSRASPSEVERNLRYVRALMAFCLSRGEAPYASHALYTQPGVLDDAKPEERTKGMEAGFAWGAQAKKRVVGTDLGLTPGMVKGINKAYASGQPVEFVSVPGWEP